MPADFSAMLRQLKRNEAAKAARRAAHLRKKKKLVFPNGYSKVKAFDFPDVSKKELAKIKSNIRKSIKKDKTKQLTLLITLSVIALIIIVNSVDFTTPKKIQPKGISQDNFLSENINEFSFLIDDGDQWIQKRRWNNAIYRYEQAVKLFPSSYEANYRLALAYKYNCEFKNKSCIQGEKLTEKLLKYHPDELNLINLKVAFQQKKKSQNNKQEY